jgi:hypothetical protein
MKLILWIRSLLVAALIFGAGSTMLYSNTQNASEQMLISAIEAGDLADFVAISGGLQQGIERGMGLSVFRNEQKIGELLVTRSESDCSVALITSISPNEALALGDRATPKLRTF